MFLRENLPCFLDVLFRVTFLAVLTNFVQRANPAVCARELPLSFRASPPLERVKQKKMMQ
jgi:hypothetical protein